MDKYTQLRSFTSNRIAQLQFELIRSALNLADYRVRRDRITDSYRWQIWHKSQPRHSAVTLSYDGWGKSIGQWWFLPPSVPKHIFDIVCACSIHEEKSR